VIDSTFYGVFLENHLPGSPTPWFHGQVIDMLFFPIFEFYWPQWVPVLGGEDFLFFSPVFSIADSAIFLGVVFILIYQKKFFKDKASQPTDDQEVNMNNDSGVQFSSNSPEDSIERNPSVQE
jgi:signal peptidase II